MTANTEPKVDEFCDSFISRLEALVEKGDRGALAMLRRGLGKQAPFEAYRFMPFRRTRWQEEAALLIGPLFALWHQGEEKPGGATENGNLGASLLALVHVMVLEAVKHDDAMKRVERRFSALLNCHAEDLKAHLHHAVSLLKSKEVPINWRRLLRDVEQWDHEDRWVEREWARAFWASKAEDSTLPDDQAEAETPDNIEPDSE